MTPQVISLSSLGSTAWIPVDYKQNPFNISIACVVSDTPNLTYQVEFTLDDIFNPAITPKAFVHNTITGRTSDFSATQTQPIRAIRITTTAYISGTVTMTALQGIINPVIHVSDPITLYQFETPSWSSPSVNWDSAKYPITPSISVNLDGSMRGSAGITPEELFDRFSTARSAPTTTYYVNATTGSDSNNGLTTGTKVQSIKKAIDLGNATGSPYKVMVDAGVYYRLFGFRAGTSVAPTEDAAFIAVGGDVICTSGNDLGTPSLDGTYTNCYAWAQTLVTSVLDLTRMTDTGAFEQLRYVATPTICNRIPGTWTLSDPNVYVHRPDGAAVTNANTRVVTYSNVWKSSTSAHQVSVFLGSDGEGGRFIIQGGGADGGLSVEFGASVASSLAFVCDQVVFEHSGGFAASITKAAYFNGIPGIVALFGCFCRSGANDAYNFKNSSGSGMHVLTVNCSAAQFGQNGSTSNNGWTLHENVVGVDVCGNYAVTAGGAVHNIATSKAALIGTTISGDRGDSAYGGTIKPTAVRAANTAEIQMYACTVLQSNGLHLHADDTSVIVTDADITRLRTAGDVTQRV